MSRSLTERWHVYRRARARDRRIYSDWEMAGPLSVVAVPCLLMLAVAWAHYPMGGA